MSVLPGYAADDGFKAPAEWDVHEQTWMGFPQVETFSGVQLLETRYLEGKRGSSTESVCQRCKRDCTL